MKQFTSRATVSASEVSAKGLNVFREVVQDRLLADLERQVMSRLMELAVIEQVHDPLSGHTNFRATLTFYDPKTDYHMVTMIPLEHSL